MSYSIVDAVPGLLNIPVIYQPFHEMVAALVEDIVTEIREFVESLPCQSRVCFVLDGEPLHAKCETHKVRARKSYQHLKAARRIVNLYVGKQTHQSVEAVQRNKFLAKFGGKASGWIRWFDYLKQHVVKELVRHDFANGFDPEGQSKYSVVVAPYEADPTCVELASLVHDSIILSNDGDLQIYPYADNSLVSGVPDRSDSFYSSDLLFLVTGALFIEG